MNQQDHKTNNNAANEHKSSYPLDRYTVQPKQAANNNEEQSPYYKSSAPSISLPKGGGALKGIDEKFSVNAVNGTAALQVSLPITPGRSGFTPNLSLSYNSGGGNTEFGLGWGLGLPSISRRTDKRLPSYDDANESDVFLLSGAEDLVPKLDGSGNAIITTYATGGNTYHARQYIPRIEGLFARIEHITKDGSAASWWRVTGKDNTVTYYGLTAAGRIADPSNSSRIFKWLPQLGIDRKGNVQEYSYINENASNVIFAAHEHNRLNNTALFTNTYLKSVKYCNTTPFTIASAAIYEPSFPVSPRYLMEVVFDYGDHSTTVNTSVTPNTYTIPHTPDTVWPVRKDPFSDFHAGFEIRTYRRCRRVLMFHYFNELNAGNAVLIHSLDMQYQQDTNMTDTYTEADFITSFTSNGYTRTTGEVYTRKSLPAFTCNYQPLSWSSNLQNVSTADAENAPQGLTGPYQWIDLYGEGLPGILSEYSGGWYYKNNMGNGHFTPAQRIAPKPSYAGLGSSMQWSDLQADGRRQLVSRDTSNPGYFELDDDQNWQSFTAFKEWVNVDWNSPYTRILDLNGDGRPDILLTEERAWRWYENEGTDGYALGGEVSATLNEEKGPRILLNDMMQVIFLADMNGDGMTDIVRIQNGEVSYWPNMGYGIFGAKVTMTNAPVFDLPDQFNPVYITLADISGTGAADIIYLGKNKCTAWVNLAGNAFSNPTVINPLPGTEQYSKIGVMDFLGSGTACIVWSSPLPQHSWAPMRYIDLMGGNKPYLLTSYSNGMGKSTTLTYRHSTQYYLDDKQAGTPWATRLPFPVHCIQQVATSDSVSETAYIQSYTYHHGYYDHEEREFRGFGRVDTIDTDAAKYFNSGTSTENDLDQAPVLTKTWYHTGAWMRESNLIDQFELEYYNNANWNLAGLASYPTGLNAQETREAHRALKSSPLRQEIYALDGTSQQGIPYSVTANSYIIKLVQNLWGNMYAGFFTHQQENVVWHCERNAADARILHDLTLNVDQYGNVLESAKVAYPRAAAAIPAGTPSVVASTQQVMLVTYTVNAFTNDVVDTSGPTDNYRLREPYESKSYQLTSLSVPTGLWLPANLQSAYAAITGANEIDYSATPSATIVQKRFLSLHRTVYLKDDTTAALTLGTMQSLGMPYQQYQLAMTNAMVTDAYGSLVTNSMITEGGYLREDTITPFASANTNNYWLPGGTMQYSTTPSPANTFYSPVGFTDPWGNQTSITYWGSYYLLPASETDALSNVTTVNSYDFRCLQPTEIIDPNTNISDIIYDELCMPVAMALRGKGTGTEGDNLTSLNPDSPTDLGYQAAFWSDPEGNASNLLKGATWRCVYNLNTSPIAVAMIGREQHYAVNSNSPMQLRITYTDGFGRVAMHKVQAANNPSTGAVRWIGSGKTVYNNKGNVVLQYEPYYSSTFVYDPALQAASAGVSPRMHYDPAGRVIQTDIPDGSFTKTTWNAWLQVAYDNNDTVNDSAWYAARTGTGSLSGIAEEADAAAKATQHYNTPTTIHFDTLAQPFYTVQQNRHLVSGTWVTDPTFESYVVLDVLGNRLAIHDARGLNPISYKHDMLKGIIRQVSMDSGTQHVLGDIAGQPLYTWDADNRQFHFHYDQLRRPSQKDVTPSGGSTKVLEVTLYGEGVSGAAAANLKGMPYKVYDGAGLTTIPSYDFKGNPNTKVRQYVTDYTHHPDWTTIASVAMESATYGTTMTYDALNRPVTITTPDNGVTAYTYEKTGLLYSVSITNIHGLSSTIISSIIYDAKGQRQSVRETYQNGGGTVTNTTTTAYTYDANTFRVIEIKTTRSSDNAVLQDLKYWYDPVGNITKQEDAAQQTVYFSGGVASPNNDYTYDALYRLIVAQGREHAGNNAAVTNNDSSRMGIIPTPVSAADTAKMRTYIQYYTYDAVGNMLEMKHTATGGVGNWTRDFTISGSNNKTLSTTIGSNGTGTESYTYDTRGNITTGFNHLNTLTYNELNRLEVVIGIGGAVTTWYQYDATGERVRKVTVDASSNTEKRRLYDGQWELYTHKTTGTTDLTRETLHIMDDKARIALVDTPTFNTTGSGETQNLRYQFSNHLSTATLELDFNAANISYEEYYPFGSTSFQSGRSAAEVSLKRYRYTAKERDEETGLYYHGARYYAPWLGRWIAVDPINNEIYNLDKGQKDRNIKRDFIELTASSYEYCYANPVRFSDPKGEQVPPNQQNGSQQQAMSQYIQSPTAARDATYVDNSQAILMSKFINDPNPTAFQAAEMADDSYKEYKDRNQSLSGGWKRVEKLGDFQFDKNEIGYQSALYMRTINGKTAYVYATAGTDPGSPQDILADLSQPAGLSEQYAFSVARAKELKGLLKNELLKGATLTFVGHSLGGGEASANALATNLPAITFNAAGLSIATKLRENIYFKNSDKIRAFIIPGEAVDYYQGNILHSTAEGDHTYIHPWFGSMNSISANIVKNAPQTIFVRIKLHLMPAVFDALKKSGYGN